MRLTIPTTYAEFATTLSGSVENNSKACKAADSSTICVDPSTIKIDDCQSDESVCFHTTTALCVFPDQSRNTVRAPLIGTGTHRFFGHNGI